MKDANICDKCIHNSICHLRIQTKIITGYNGAITECKDFRKYNLSTYQYSLQVYVITLLAFNILYWITR